MKFGKCFGTLAATVVIASLGASGEAATISETFDFPTSPSGLSQEEALAEIGWCGGHAGDAVCQTPVSGEGAVSGGGSFLFFSKTNIGADAYLFTEKYSFEFSDLLSISWEMADSPNAGEAHVALRIADTWFISDQSTSVGSKGNFVQTGFGIGALTFGLTATDNAGVLANAQARTSTAPISGTVNAVGFLWDETKRGTSRIDNLDLELAPVPLPAGAWMMLAGIGGLAVAGRRKKRS